MRIRILACLFVLHFNLGIFFYCSIPLPLCVGFADVALAGKLKAGAVHVWKFQNS